MKEIFQTREHLLHLQKGKPINFLWSFERLRSSYVAGKCEANALRFMCMNHVAQLSSLLGFSLSSIERLINESKYQQFKIVKRKGGYRTISAPNPILKKAQSILNYYLQACYYVLKPECSYGFVINPHPGISKYNIVRNAEQHIGKKEILNIDIEDFFPSISTRKVYELFHSELFEFPEHLSRCLALLCTYQAQLPTGAPTSPVLSNLICMPMDLELEALAKEHECTYTRYADDLSFSSEITIVEGLEDKIYDVLAKYGFKSQKKKRRLQKYFQHQNVTGVVVNEKLNLKRDKIKKIRAMLHDAQVNGLIAASQKHYTDTNLNKQNMLALKFLHYLKAEVSYVKYVRGDDFLTQRFEQQLGLIQHHFVF